MPPSLRRMPSGRAPWQHRCRFGPARRGVVWAAPPPLRHACRLPLPQRCRLCLACTPTADQRTAKAMQEVHASLLALLQINVCIGAAACKWAVGAGTDRLLAKAKQVCWTWC